jgi:hypothetical protein
MFLLTGRTRTGWWTKSSGQWQKGWGDSRLCIQKILTVFGRREMTRRKRKNLSRIPTHWRVRGRPKSGLTKICACSFGTSFRTSLVLYKGALGLYFHERPSRFQHSSSMLNTHGTPKKNSKGACRMQDEDCDGVLSRPEFFQAMFAGGFDVGRKNVERVWKLANSHPYYKSAVTPG